MQHNSNNKNDNLHSGLYKQKFPNNIYININVMEFN